MSGTSTGGIDTMRPEQAHAFMAGPAFAKNPVGETFDPEELVRRYEAVQAVNSFFARTNRSMANTGLRATTRKLSAKDLAVDR